MADFLPFEAKLARVWPPARWNEVTTLVGLSGGADSVALLRALCAVKGEAPGRIVAAHFNHRWRGAESDGDEEFCRELAKRLGVEILVGRAEGGEVSASTSTSTEGRSREGGGGSEEEARRERYHFFESAAREVGARYLVLAHHRDDQVETVLQRLIRGSSLRGIAGMGRLRRLSELTTLVRPLLSCPRRAIEKYLAAAGESYRVDSTNADPTWLRNRIREELIPLLESKYAHQASRSVARLAAEAGEAAEFLEQFAEEAMAGRVILNPGKGEATLFYLPSPAPYLLRLVLVRIWKEMGWPVGAMTRKHWRRLAEQILGQKKGSLGDYPGAIQASCAVAGVLVLAKKG